MKFAILFLVIVSPIHAFACSCSNASLMSEIVESGAHVMLVSPVGGGKEIVRGYSHTDRFRVWKSYTDEEPTPYQTISNSLGSSCVADFPVARTSILVAYRNTSNSLETDMCSDGGFTDREWINFFELGLDLPAMYPCFGEISRAYDYKDLDGKFILERPECSVHIPAYDNKYR